MSRLINCFSIFRRRKRRNRTTIDRRVIELNEMSKKPEESCLTMHYASNGIRALSSKESQPEQTQTGVEETEQTPLEFEDQFVSKSGEVLSSSSEVSENQSNFDHLLYLERETERWKLRLSKDSVRIYIKREGKEHPMVKAFFDLEIDASPEQLYEILYNTQLRLSWDSQVVTQFEVIENPAPDVVHYYMVNKAPWPFADRDFVEKRYTRRRDNGDIEIFYLDTPHADYPELQDNKKFERGRILFGGQIFRKRISQNTGKPTLLVTLISQADMRVAVPSKIIEQTLPMSLAKWHRNIKKQLVNTNLK